MCATTGSTWGASRSILLIVYRALIRSVIDYRSMAYDSAAANTKEKVDRLHNRLRGSAAHRYLEHPERRYKWNVVNQCSAFDDDVYSPTIL